MEFLRNGDTVDRVRINAGRSSPGLYTTQSDILDICHKLETYVRERARPPLTARERWVNKPNLKRQAEAVASLFEEHGRPTRRRSVEDIWSEMSESVIWPEQTSPEPTDLVRDIDVLIDRMLEDEDIAFKVGCSDPKLVIRMRDSFASVTKADTWRSIPYEGQVIIQGCNGCPTCLAKNTAVLGGLSKAAFYVEPRAVALCRTFADDAIQRHQSVSLALDRKFRLALKRKLKAAFPGRDITVLSAHEMGSTRLRRHFHDLVIGVTEPELLALLDAEWFVQYHAEAMYKVDDWPHGHVNVAAVEDAAQVFYAGKYASKGIAMAAELTDAARADAARLRAIGEPILKSYIFFPRMPALGRAALTKLVTEQADRLVEEHAEALRGNWRQHRGLILPSHNGEPDRPVAMRPQDRRHAVQVLRQVTGLSLDGSVFTGPYINAETDALRESYQLRETEVVS